MGIRKVGHSDSMKDEFIIPNQYKEFLKICNGISFDCGLILYSLEELKQLNEELQVQQYQRNYIAIGDDGGGLVFLMKQETNAEEVICVEMSDYDVNDPFCKIKNFSAWYKEGCNIPEEITEKDNDLGEVGDLYLIKMPDDGMKGLIKMKKIFHLNISTSELIALSKALPSKLIENITHAKAIKLMEKAGETEIFKFRKSDK